MAGAKGISPFKDLSTNLWITTDARVMTVKRVHVRESITTSPCRTMRIVRSFRSPIPTFEITPRIHMKIRISTILTAEI
jgi:hypothetical protein